MSRELEHTCHIPYCLTVVKPELLMCLTHWRKVPKQIKKRVWLHYQDGQCNLSPPPSRQWHQAAKDAINHVVFLERRTSRQTTLL